MADVLLDNWNYALRSPDASTITWQVVGGSDKGGIIVRKAQDTTSELEQQRLATGSLITQLELQGERLHYKIWPHRGDGPDTGWISIKLKGKDLAVMYKALRAVPPPGWTRSNDPTATPEALRKPLAPPCPVSQISGRKLRILALHGGQSNTSLLKFQSARFRKLLGSKKFEWIFPDAPVLWDSPLKPPGAVDNNYYAPRSEVELTVSKGQPFKSWVALAEYDDGYREMGVDRTPESLEDSAAYFRGLVSEHQPDVVLGFSQGAFIVTKVLNDMERDGEEVSWRLNLFFCPAPFGRFDAFDSSMPTCLVVSTENDTMSGLDITSYSTAYCHGNLQVLSHRDGHTFPSSQPLADELYDQIKSLIDLFCPMEAES